MCRPFHGVCRSSDHSGVFRCTCPALTPTPAGDHPSDHKISPTKIPRALISLQPGRQFSIGLLQRGEINLSNPRIVMSSTVPRLTSWMYSQQKFPTTWVISGLQLTTTDQRCIFCCINFLTVLHRQANAGMEWLKSIGLYALVTMHHVPTGPDTPESHLGVYSSLYALHVGHDPTCHFWYVLDFSPRM